MPVVRIRYWAGAKRAAGTDGEDLDADTLADVRAALQLRPELTTVSQVASFLVDGMRANDATELAPGAVVDVLPPFAGG